MAELDVMLSESLKRAANPGDPTGVADAIRARVAAGDTGAPASVSGFGSRRWWVLWLTLAVVVTLVTGGALAFGVPALTPPTTTAVATASSTPRATPSATPSPTPTASPTPTPTPTFTPTEEPVPAPAPPPAPPADTTPPTLGVPSASPSAVYTGNGTATTIAVTASDDVGVTAVTISWSGYQSGSASMQPGWSYIYQVPQAGAPPSGSTITFTAQAVDAAGNVSAPQIVVVTVGF